MSNTRKTKNESGFNYEPNGTVYSSNTKIKKNKDGTISLQPEKKSSK